MYLHTVPCPEFAMTTPPKKKRVMEDMVVLDEKYAGWRKTFFESEARLAAAKGVKRDCRVTGESSSATKRVHFMASPSYKPLSKEQQATSSRFDPLFSAIQDDTNVLTPLTAVHLQVADYVFSDRGTNNRRSSKPLYSYKTYFATRMHLWSLKPSEHVSSVVIDCWSSYLNCKEEENNLCTPKRFFFTTLVHSVLAKPSPGLSDEKIYELFEARAKMELQLFPGIEIASIALFFFPIVHEKHFFLYVVDLVRKRFVILDNSLSDEDAIKKYGVSPLCLNLTHFCCSIDF
ncbi:uncharacterized protein LOC141613477 [Silene latifolia]|uniref:uncharacterized protein LOC141613477 n=1 Tax=Silene latifolia TaxID=37657 RepID=UPI003D785585